MLRYASVEKPMRVFNYASDPGWEAAVAGNQDMAGRINFLNARAIAKNYSAMYLPWTGYDIRIGSPITFGVGLGLVRDKRALLRSINNAATTHVTFGSPGVENRNVYIDIDLIRDSGSDWSDANDIGILIHDIFGPSYIHELSCFGFTNNIVFRTETATSFVNVQLGQIGDGRYNLTLLRAGSSGYINQMNWIGGGFWTQSNKRAGISWVAGRYPVGVRFARESTSNNHTFNAHWFQGTSFEINVPLASPAWEDQACFQFDATVSNMLFEFLRHENNLPVFVRDNAGAVGVSVSLSYATDRFWTPSQLWHSNFINEFDGNKIGTNYRSVVEAPVNFCDYNLAKKAKQYDSGGSIRIPGYYWRRAGNDTRYDSSFQTGHLINTDNVELTNTGSDGLCVLVHVEDVKMLTFEPLVDGTENCRQCYIPWDAARTQRLTSGLANAPDPVSGAIPTGAIPGGNILDAGWFESVPEVLFIGGGGTGATATATLASTPGPISTINITGGGSGYTSAPTLWFRHDHYVKGGLEPSTNFGKCYQSGNNSASPTSVYVGPLAKWLEYVIWPLSGTLKLRGLRITSNDGGAVQAQSWFAAGFPQADQIRVASQPSNTWKGNWSDGDVAINAAPAASGDPWGWRKRGTNFDALNP